MNGISYFASNQWFVAQHKPPHLAAICVWEGAADWYREFARHGGISQRLFSTTSTHAHSIVCSTDSRARVAQSRHRRIGIRPGDVARRAAEEESNRYRAIHSGFAQQPFYQRVHPTIQWAKLETLVAGARIASKELWGRGGKSAKNKAASKRAAPKKRAAKPVRRKRAA